MQVCNKNKINILISDNTGIILVDLALDILNNSYNTISCKSYI